LELTSANGLYIIEIVFYLGGGFVKLLLSVYNLVKKSKVHKVESTA